MPKSNYAQCWNERGTSNKWNHNIIFCTPSCINVESWGAFPSQMCFAPFGCRHNQQWSSCDIRAQLDPAIGLNGPQSPRGDGAQCFHGGAFLLSAVCGGRGGYGGCSRAQRLSSVCQVNACLARDISFSIVLVGNCWMLQATTLLNITIWTR